MDEGDKKPTLFTWEKSPTEFAFFFLIEFVTILLLFVCLFSYFGYLGHKIILATCRISAHQPGIEPTPPALEGEVLTTGQPGKSLAFGF